jgi:hypothetical protein
MGRARGNSMIMVKTENPEKIFFTGKLKAL